MKRKMTAVCRYFGTRAYKNLRRWPSRNANLQTSLAASKRNGGFVGRVWEWQAACYAAEGKVEVVGSGCGVGWNSYNFSLDRFENFWVFIFMNNLLHQNNLGKYMLYKEHRPSILCVLRYIAHPFKMTRLQRPVLIQLLFVEDKFFKPLKNKREMMSSLLLKPQHFQQSTKGTGVWFGVFTPILHICISGPRVL